MFWFRDANVDTRDLRTMITRLQPVQRHQLRDEPRSDPVTADTCSKTPSLLTRHWQLRQANVSRTFLPANNKEWAQLFSEILLRNVSQCDKEEVSLCMVKDTAIHSSPILHTPPGEMYGPPPFLLRHVPSRFSPSRRARFAVLANSSNWTWLEQSITDAITHTRPESPQRIRAPLLAPTSLFAGGRRELSRTTWARTFQSGRPSRSSRFAPKTGHEFQTINESASIPQLLLRLPWS